MRPAIASLLLLSRVCHATLNVDTYDNCALHGASTATAVPSLDFTVAMGGSAEVTGLISFNEAGYYAFDCSFGGGQLVFVWVDDHLVCHTNPPFGNTPSSTDGSPQYPLHYGKGASVPIIVHIYAYAEEGPITSAANANVTVQWATLLEPMSAGAKPTFVPVPASILSPATTPNEQRRRELQKGLASGWNLWTYNLLDVTKLPDSFALSLALCQLSTSACLRQTNIEDTHASIRVGPFAADQSYWQLYVWFAGVNVSISVTGGASALNVLVEPVNCSRPGGGVGLNCSDYALVVSPRFVWFRAGTRSVDAASGSISVKGAGFDETTISPTAAPAAGLSLPDWASAPHAVAFSLGAGAIGLSESAASLGTVTKTVAAARAAELARYAKYGDLAEVKEGLQAATLWNYIYSPAEYGPFLPVSRSWNFVKQAVNNDWAYVIFDWDNIFASYMTSLDAASKGIAYSNLIQVIRSRTSKGFVPNYSAGGSKSVDRTEPPIGAKVLLDIHTKYNDTWLVELLYDDLKLWNDWFVGNRAFGPLGIISLGSDTIDGYQDYSAGEMQGARFESGLDNSPMCAALHPITLHISTQFCCARPG